MIEKEEKNSMTKEEENFKKQAIEKYESLVSNTMKLKIEYVKQKSEVLKKQIYYPSDEMLNMDDIRHFIICIYMINTDTDQCWISVEEKLPLIDDGIILIKGIGHDGREGIVYVGYMKEPNTSYADIISFKDIVLRTTHWQTIDL